VTPDVLIPRPETEHVVEVALRIARGEARVLDVGNGSGALAVTLQLETSAEAWATDISPAAAKVAAGNARRLGAPVNVVICDLMEGIAPGAMDLIVSNPPYVPIAQREGLQREVRDWEPHVALFAGETGFEIYDRIVADAPRVLGPGGWLVMELGFGSRDYVANLLSGWRDVRIEPDLAGIPRVIAARAMPDQEGIDRLVVPQAADDSAWETPIQVKRSKPASLAISGELAARAAFLARLHREAGVAQWVERVIARRVGPDGIRRGGW